MILVFVTIFLVPSVTCRFPALFSGAVPGMEPIRPLGGSSFSQGSGSRGLETKARDTYGGQSVQQQFQSQPKRKQMQMQTQDQPDAQKSNSSLKSK